MLVAIGPDGERVCSLDALGGAFDLRDRYRAGEVTCPDCGGTLIAKHGMLLVPHFAHRPEDPLDQD